MFGIGIDSSARHTDQVQARLRTQLRGSESHGIPSAPYPRTGLPARRYNHCSSSRQFFPVVTVSVVPYNAHSWLLADQPICTSRLEQVCSLETCELRVCPIVALFGSCIVGTDVQQTQSRNHKRLRDGFESGGCPRTSGVWKLLPVFSLSK